MAAIFVLIALSSYSAVAREGARVILVLDASGSMWGQIGGAAKMDIAKNTVGKIIGNWRAQDELGLVVYGHRKKGQCSDIELVRRPALLNAASYMSAVNRLVPKGKTPMTQSIRMAAEALKFTEKEATVILVSDGIETCDPDPCAVASELEKLGINFTVHTVGFNIADKIARAQLRCLAENTGGKAFNADDARGLEKAITEAVKRAQEPVITRANIDLVPVDKKTGRQLAQSLNWSIINPADESIILDGRSAPLLKIGLEPGRYQVLAERGALSGGAVFTVPDVSPMTVKVPVADLTPTATLKATDEVVAASKFEVEWSGPGGKHDAVVIIDPAANHGEGKVLRQKTIKPDNNKLAFIAPSKPARYDLMYWDGKLRKYIGKRPVTVTNVKVDLIAPASVPASSTFNIEWVGPGQRHDQIVIWDPAANRGEGKSVRYKLIQSDNNTIKLIAPSKPGAYQLRYWQGNDRKYISSKPLEVTPVNIKLDFPSSAPAASNLKVEWTGPGQRHDQIVIWDPAANRGEGKSVRYKLIQNDNNAVKLILPSKPGSYEVRYWQGTDRKYLFSKPLEVTPVTIGLEYPTSVPASSIIKIDWKGPGQRVDQIIIWDPAAKRGAGKSVRSRRVASDNNSVKLTAPPKPGAYEIRYWDGNDRKYLFSKPLQVAPVEFALDFPPSVAVDSSFTVSWKGPGLQSDRIYIWDPAAGNGKGKRLSSMRIDDDNDVQMRSPKKPGTYEIRYWLNTDGLFLIKKPITITP